MKRKDFSYKKLEFYLQIYFVVYIKHPNINSQTLEIIKVRDADQELKEA